VRRPSAADAPVGILDAAGHLTIGWPRYRLSVDTWLFVLLALVPVLVLLSGAIVVARRRRERADGAVAALGVDRQETANSLGFTSLGKSQVRGNCTVGLDGFRLVVAQWVPARTTEIPLDRIVEVDTARTHLGKWVGRDLLRVRFRREDGSEDDVALVVRDVPGWVEELRRRVP